MNHIDPQSHEAQSHSEPHAPAPFFHDATGGRPPLDVNKLILAGAIVFAGVLVAGAVIWTNMRQPADGSPRTAKVSVDDDAILGDTKAPVTIIEFSDYQCPFCRAFWRETYPRLKKDFIETGKVRLVFRDFPLSSHPAAIPAAHASECAEEQGKFWEMHDIIFAEQDAKGVGTVSFSSDDLKRWAGKIGLKQNEFNACLDSGKYNEEIAKDLKDGVASGVSGTPSFFINGNLLVGAQPYETFQAAIEQILADK
ncbi:MAG: DsbA family protein [Candidatus Paceibacterota bacterium]|nr:MAG: DsbA family protein [Candidatus Paceibacterota bacterium]